MIEPAMSGDFGTLMEWADKHRRLKVRTNAETPLDAETARKFGAEGIGLCRTEHMFFDPTRIGAVRQMIMADDEHGRRTALARLLPFQRAGFHRPVPHHGAAAGDHPPARPAAARVPAARRRRTAEVAERWAPTSTAMRRRAGELAEANPMLGHRGCRLGVTYPGDLRNAGPRDLRGRHRGGQGDRHRADPGNHDPAGRHEEGAGNHPRPGGQGGRRRCSPRPAPRSSTPSAP